MLALPIATFTNRLDKRLQVLADLPTTFALHEHSLPSPTRVHVASPGQYQTVRAQAHKPACLMGTL